MKNILFLLIIFSLALVGCNGKDRVHKTNTEVLKEHKLLDSFSEKVEYIPETYTEINTDTILSNGFSIKIKGFVDMENAVLFEFKENGINYKHYFRKLINIIEIYNKEKLIFKETLTDIFLNKINSKYPINKDYINNIAYLDDFNISEKDKVTIILSHCIPRTVNCPDYKLIIEKKGSYELKETN